MAPRRGTAITERGLPAPRNLSIHWAQESFAQAGLVREFVKWDYKLRRGDQLETAVDRVLAVACPTDPGLRRGRRQPLPGAPAAVPLPGVVDCPTLACYPRVALPRTGALGVIERGRYASGRELDS